MKMKILIAMTAVLAMASSSMAGWFHEDFESYATEDAWMAAWPLTSNTSNLFWNTTGGIEGPQCVGGAKTARRQEHDLVPHIQAAPGGAGMTAFNGTDSQALLMEVYLQLKEDSLISAQSQGFYWDLVKADGSGGRGFAVGAHPVYGGTSSRAGLMYYDGLNWTELTTLKHSMGWNHLRAIIKATTVSFIYEDDDPLTPPQMTTVNRAYLGGFEAMGINSTKCTFRVNATDAYDLDGGVFVPEPATVLLLGLGGLALMRRRRVA